MTHVKKLAIVFGFALVALGCGKKKESAAADPAPSGKTDPAPSGKGVPAPTTPSEPAPAADPTADWQVHTGKGFTVRGPQAPTEKESTTEMGPVTAYNAYAIPGSPGAFQVHVVAIPEGASFDLDKGVEAAVASMPTNMPGAKVDEVKPLTLAKGVGKEIVASGTHPQRGAFVARARQIFYQGRYFQVSVLYAADKADFARQAGVFLDSFALTD